jgi:hypothetical protein
MEIVGVLDTGLDVVPVACRVLKPACDLHAARTVGRCSLAAGIGADDHSEALTWAHTERFGVVVEVVHSGQARPTA